MDNNEREYLDGEDVAEDFLAHFGVMGMKWGVRNDETRARYGNKISSSQKYDNKPGTAKKASSGPTGTSLHRRAKKANEAMAKKTSGKVSEKFSKAAKKNDRYINKRDIIDKDHAAVKSLMSEAKKNKMSDAQLAKRETALDKKLTKDLEANSGKNKSKDKILSAKQQRQLDKKANKAEDKFVQRLNTEQWKVSNAAADIINPKVEKFNADPRWKGMDLINNENGKTEKAYIDAYNKMYVESLNQALGKLGLDKSPKGAVIKYVEPPKGSGPGEYSMEVEEPKVKHSDFTDDSLTHYGVMGMKWGVRRDQRALDRAAGRTPTIRTQSLRNKSDTNKALTKGAETLGLKRVAARGQKQNERNDRVMAKRDAKIASKVSETKVSAAKAKLDKSTKALEKRQNPTKGMSDQQLRNEINRMSMEKQYSQLTKPEKSTGRKVAEAIFVATATQAAAEFVKENYKKAGKTAVEVVKKAV